MNIFDVLTLIGGICLFLFGMNIMGQALERSAGSKLEGMLGRFTSSKLAGFATGIGVTAIIQSSSATTVMVVGFVNSGIMTLKQAIHVIMGANVGTTITAWVLSLGGISGDNIFLKLLKPTSFTPILAVIGIIFYMFGKSNRRKDIGTILLGFSVLMFGMDTMTGAVSGLADVPAFQQLFILFKNPILGLLVGAVLTAIIQSSSASVGILQALAITGQVSYGAAIPIIMGQNIGTCVTSVISSIGTSKNAKRAAFVHLSFNVFSSVLLLIAYSIINSAFSPALFNQAATLSGIAIAHSIFNIVGTVILLPMSGIIERLAYKLIPDAQSEKSPPRLDNRLLATPSIALESCHSMVIEMAKASTDALKNSILCLKKYDDKLYKSVEKDEEKTDEYEDLIGSFLVKLSPHSLNERDGATASMLLKAIGDFERINDHAVNLSEAALELHTKGIVFSENALRELDLICSATVEITNLACSSFVNARTEIANFVEPLEQVIDDLYEILRSRHIERLRHGECNIESGFIWNDIITNIERVADHCSNIAGCMIDAKRQNMNIHKTLRATRHDSKFYKEKYEEYAKKYLNAI